MPFVTPMKATTTHSMISPPLSEALSVMRYLILQQHFRRPSVDEGADLVRAAHLAGVHEENGVVRLAGLYQTSPCHQVEDAILQLDGVLRAAVAALGPAVSREVDDALWQLAQ